MRVSTHIVRKEDYDAWKEAAYQRKVRLPRYEPLVRELKGLQVVNERRVDHPRGGSKDVADAVVNCWWLASRARRRPRAGYWLIEGW